MNERTDLVLILCDRPVCARCTALAAPFDPDGLCDRCRCYAGLLEATRRWSPDQRSALTSLVSVLVTTCDPGEAEQLLLLVRDLVVAEH